jgi:murein DD-endopeptidase MepM/ murein hydrolase activator NlpD
MPSVAELLSARRAPQVAVLALMSFAFAGCSADMSTRLAQSGPSANPYRSEATGSVPRAAPTPSVERRELPQYARPQHSAAPSYQSQSLPPPAAPASYPVAAAPAAAPARPMPSYVAPASPAIESTGATSRSGAAAGGTRIIVGTSDTLEGLAKRYNVPTSAILAANGYRGPRILQPGQSLVIPSQQAAAPAAAPRLAAAASGGNVHVVNSGDTLAGIARRSHVSVDELARANQINATTPLKIGQKLTMPGGQVAAAAPVPVAAAAPAQPTRVASAAPLAPVAPAAPAEPVQKVRMASATATPEPAVAAQESPVKAAEATGALPTFRWPVRGRVITAYGAKTNGKANDGINLAVPEGTPVKAAEDGVVAYAGNELKGYGNLVLVRHSNGYVTAYAHASEVMVKRGETIKRGQVIAKSGQSGEVGSPQLHFEIRKGSAPVDPLQFLNGA